MKNKKIFSVFICFLVITFFCNGCVGYSPRMKGIRIKKSKYSLPYVTVADDAISFTETMDLDERYDDIANDISSYINDYFSYNEHKQHKFIIDAISISLESRASNVAQPIILSIISTPIIVPFSLIPTRQNVSYDIHYALNDEQGKLLHTGVVQGTTKAYCRGWSFFRFVFRAKMYRGMPHAVIDSIKMDIVKDIVEYDRYLGDTTNFHQIYN